MAVPPSRRHHRSTAPSGALQAFQLPTRPTVAGRGRIPSSGVASALGPGGVGELAHGFCHHGVRPIERVTTKASADRLWMRLTLQRLPVQLTLRRSRRSRPPPPEEVVGGWRCLLDDLLRRWRARGSEVCRLRRTCKDKRTR